MATMTRLAFELGVLHTPGPGVKVADDVGVGIGPLPPPPRSSLAQAAKPATIATAIQYRERRVCMLSLPHGLKSDSGIGNATVAPMPVVAVNVRVTDGWPIGRPATENGKVACHCPGPTLWREAIGSSEFGPNRSCATFVVVIAEMVMGSPFLITDGET